ncbi:hypothetical protein [Pedobacter sp. P26]|uniref:hypothetical protein n=1 Tax=Pedobacter sp. P26 TaxID=3423956 RepID=UPI003D66BD59
MKKNIVLIAFLFITNLCYGQIKEFEAEKKKIYAFLSESVSKIKFKDTTDFYSFAFKINVKAFGKDKYVVSIESNDSLANVWFPKQSYFKTLDYSPLFGNNIKEINLVVPIVLGTYGKKDINQKNNLEIIQKIGRLFYSQKDISIEANEKPEWKKVIVPKSETMIYLFPFISVYDLKTYN